MRGRCHLVSLLSHFLWWLRTQPAGYSAIYFMPLKSENGLPTERRKLFGVTWHSFFCCLLPTTNITIGQDRFSFCSLDTCPEREKNYKYTLYSQFWEEKRSGSKKSCVAIFYLFIVLIYTTALSFSLASPGTFFIGCHCSAIFFWVAALQLQDFILVFTTPPCGALTHFSEWIWNDCGHLFYHI